MWPDLSQRLFPLLLATQLTKTATATSRCIQIKTLLNLYSSLKANKSFSVSRWTRCLPFLPPESSNQSDLRAWQHGHDSFLHNLANGISLCFSDQLVEVIVVLESWKQRIHSKRNSIRYRMNADRSADKRHKPACWARLSVCPEFCNWWRLCIPTLIHRSAVFAPTPKIPVKTWNTHCG